MDWWTPPLDPSPFAAGTSPATFLFYWAIPAVAVALFLLQTNWEPVQQLRRQRRFMGVVDPLRARELDREEQRLLLDAWRRAVLIVLTAGAFTIVGSTVSLAVSLWLRTY